MVENVSLELSDTLDADMDDVPMESGKELVKERQMVSKFGVARLFRGVDISPDSCIVPEAKLSLTPSSRDGMDMQTENALRYVGCELIQSMAILLQLPQVAAATGQVLFQRYYYSKSFMRNPFEHTAMACVCLASKIEEVPRRPRDVINVYNHLRQLDRYKGQILKGRRPKILPLDQHYISLKNNVIKAERRVLKELGFCVHVKHPHKLITAYMKALDCVEVPNMIQKAWSYMNDGLRTDMLTRHSAETIACACIFLAARVCQVPLPTQPRPWWELFDAKTEHVQQIALVLLQLYASNKPPSWKKLEDRVNVLKTKLTEKQKEARNLVLVTPCESINKFSPAQNDSPRDTRERLKDKNARPVNGERKDRKRSQSSSSGSPPSARKKHNKKYYDGDRRKHSRTKRSRSKSPIRIASIDPMLSKKQRRKRDNRSRSRDRSHKRLDKVKKNERREQREKEVRMELGKRRRDYSTSPDRKKIR